MAFELGLAYCQNNNCKALVLTDASADTSVIPNLTWNDVGMPAMADVSAATLDIVLSSDSLVSYSLDIRGFFWYSYLGRANGSIGGNIITGVNTTFLTDVTPGDTIMTSNMVYTYTVDTVDSDTQITLTSVLTEDLTNDWIFNASVTPYDPTQLIFDIISDDLGMATDNALLDDIYNIIYSVTDSVSGTTFTFETNVLLYCGVECCVYNLIAAIPSHYDCDNCDSSYIDNALLSWSLLIALQSSARCGSSSELTNILNLLKKICNYQPCVGCK